MFFSFKTCNPNLSCLCHCDVRDGHLEVYWLQAEGLWKAGCGKRLYKPAPGVSSTLRTTGPKKELVMQSSVVYCCVIFTWILIFSSGVQKSRALQNHRGANLTLQLEALKSGMLEYLGMDRPPDLKEKPSYRDLIRMTREYRTKKWHAQSSSGLFLQATGKSSYCS